MLNTSIHFSVSQKSSIRDLLTGTCRAKVILKPVNLSHLERLVSGPHSVRQERETDAYARWLAFGRLTYED